VTSPQNARAPLARAALIAAAAAGALLVWVVAGVIAGSPTLPGRPQADPFTIHLSALGDYAARLAAALTLGALTGAVAFLRPAPGATLDAPARRLTRLAAHAGQWWLWAAVLLTCANSAYVNGVPIGLTLRPDAWWAFQSSTPSGLAWVLSAVVAAAAVMVAFAARSLAAPALALLAGALALAFVAVTGTVTVGANHDWATDAAIWQTLASVPLVAACAAVLLLWDAPGPGLAGAASGPGAGARRRVHRYHRLVPWLVAPAALGLAVVAWQQLAGRSPLESPYGLVALAQGGVLAALLVSWAARALGRRFSLGSVVRDGVLLVAWLALASAENHLPSPRFLVPQSIQINYLGYEMPTPVDAARLLGPGRPNWLWVGLSLLALAAYAAAVLRLRRRGGRWPAGRSIAWASGWALMLYLATSGFWEYSTAVYSWHMFVHMTVNMLVPVLCVLGGPATLLREASLDRGADLPGPREVVAAITAHRPFARVFSPPVLWLNYVGSLFLIYYTPLFPWLMRYHWAHQLMLLYFMATGYAFFNLIVGVDRALADLPHLVRLAMVISIMPFHALFAVGIMSSQNLIGADFYQTIAIAWVPDLMADQNIAGQITWILGEIPLFIVMVALAAQWFAHDKAENRRFDTAADTGADQSLDAYNDMLAELARRDRDAAARRRAL